MSTTPEAVEAAKKFADKLHAARIATENETRSSYYDYQDACHSLFPYALECEGVHDACIRILAARVLELEREQSQDTKRLDFLLKHISVDDVGDECVALGICVNREDMEEALGVGKKDESGRSPLLVKSWDDNIRDVIDRAIESHGHPQPEQAKQADEVLYGLEGQELLDDEVDTIVSHLLHEHFEEPGESFDVVADRIAWPVKVLEFRRMKVSDAEKNSLAASTLESVIESLDEDYAGPDESSDRPTAPMQLAARRFIDEVVRHYVVWNCEPTGEVVEITREQAKEIVG